MGVTVIPQYLFMNNTPAKSKDEQQERDDARQHFINSVQWKQSLAKRSYLFVMVG